ncbi:MAG TPA: glycine--tRNA ligase, partial [Candidatus Nanoarchaeia archaeon]|nr:glycine--tRNA ligase [Candidatus Nanoarchaeia archaeon]
SLVVKHKILCPSCGGKFQEKAKDHTLMMRTTIGVDTDAYNRPETATTTYLPFPRYFRFFREKLPFGVFQIGKAFRNEISPRQHMLRCREFTQAEGQLFIYEDQKQTFVPFAEIQGLSLPLWDEKEQKANKSPKQITLKEAVSSKLLGSKAYAWTLHLAYELFVSMGIPKDRLRLRQHHSDEKAFYAKDAWDIEVYTNSFGWVECCGVHDRGDYDLTQHEKFSKTELKGQDQEHKKQTPHILEIAFGTDRPCFALMDLFYSSKEDNKERDLFAIPKRLAPVQVAVLPLVNKLETEALHAHKLLKNSFQTMYDRSGSVGRRYARMDEIGVPYCVTIDFDSRKNNTVTVRCRDTTKQVRVPMERIAETIKALLDNRIEFSEAGQEVTAAPKEDAE